MKHPFDHTVGQVKEETYHHTVRDPLIRIEAALREPALRSVRAQTAFFRNQTTLATHGTHRPLENRFAALVQAYAVKTAVHEQLRTGTAGRRTP